MIDEKLHFIGGLNPDSASLALYAKKQGAQVSLSDDHTDDLFAPLLATAGVRLFDSFAQFNVGKSTTRVVLSPYTDPKHPEAIAATQAKIPLVTTTDLAKQVSESSRRLAILGEYEGNLIASWLTHVWKQGHMSVQALTKTVMQEQSDLSLATGGNGDWFILPLSGFKRDALTYEADFLSHEAEIVIIPSIIYDYPELNMTLDDVYQSYYTFVKRVPRKGLIIGNGDWSRMKRLRSHLADRHIETYGFDRDVSWHIREVTESETGTTFHLAHNRQLYGPFTIPFYGTSALYAGVAVSVACLTQDMRPEVLGRGLATLPALRRYFEQRTDTSGRVIIDDSADHPEHIEEVLHTVRARFPTKKIWCLYQPGSFLRTKAMIQELQTALQLADYVYIADIKGYPKEKSEGLHSRHFVADMKQRFAHVYYYDDAVTMAELLRDRVALSDCIVTLGVQGMGQLATAPLLETK